MYVHISYWLRQYIKLNSNDCALGFWPLSIWKQDLMLHAAYLIPFQTKESYQKALFCCQTSAVEIYQCFIFNDPDPKGHNFVA